LSVIARLGAAITQHVRRADSPPDCLLIRLTLTGDVGKAAKVDGVGEFSRAGLHALVAPGAEVERICHRDRAYRPFQQGNRAGIILRQHLGAAPDEVGGARHLIG
jgi:hypothetical protein